MVYWSMGWYSHSSLGGPIINEVESIWQRKISELSKSMEWRCFRI